MKNIGRPQIGRYLYYLLEYLETLETPAHHISINMGSIVSKGKYMELYNVYATVKGCYLPDSLEKIIWAWIRTLGANAAGDTLRTKYEEDVVAVLLTHHGVTIQAHWWSAISGESDQVTLTVR